MKSLKVLILFTVLSTFSCSDDKEETTVKPAQGNVALALSNGGGFPVENLTASVSKHYGTDNTTAVTITGTAGGSGTIKITIIDNDGSFKALAKDTAFPIGDTSKSFYATVEYASDNFNLNAGTGMLKVTNYTEFKGQNYSELNATFSAAGNSNSMTSSILDLILDCKGCK